MGAINSGFAGTPLLGGRIIGSKGGGKGGGKSKKGKSDPDTFRSNSIARIFDIVSEGEIGGLVDGLKSVFVIDGSTLTPVMNDDGSMNIEGVEVFEVYGTPDQTAVSGFPAVEYESIVNAEITVESPVVREIADLDLDAIRVKIRWPRIAVIDGSGDVKGLNNEIAIDLQPDGGSYSEVVTDYFQVKSESPYEREYRIELPPGEGPWTIRVRRITPNSSGTRSQDSFWSSWTGVIDGKFRYPNTAGYFVKVDAQQFGEDSVPGRAYLVKGIKIEVPTNYDPETREYATTGPGTTGGIWDGTFKRAVCGNPAWVFRDLATNNRYGAGDEIDPDQVDKWTLYEIAQYCDEMLDDGRGGTEPRFEINTQINAQEQAYALMQAIASAFRGFPYWGAGEYPLTAGQDRPGDATKLFSTANVIGGLFNREGVDIRAQHSVALVTWNDPNDGYKPAVEQVIDRRLIKRLGWNPIQIAAFGCTSQARAHRFGRWLLDTEQNEKETVSFSVALQHADVVPGEIVNIADPVTAAVRYAGKVVSSTTTSLTIDQAVEIITGEDYVVNFVLPSGALGPDIALTNAPGEASVLTWADPADGLPQDGADWIISCGLVEPQPFRVLKIVETDKHLFEITALEHDPTKYARVEAGINLEPLSFGILPSGPLAVPQNLAAVGYLFNPGPSAQVAAILSWTPPSDARVTRFELQAALPGDSGYSVFPETLADVSYTIPNAGTGRLVFRVRSLDGVGRKSQWVVFDGQIKPLEERPEDVENFRLSVLGDQATARWDTGLDYDIDHWWIRFAPVTSGGSWETATDLEPAAPNPPVQLPAMVGTYFIKAVDFLGEESANAASYVNLAGGLSYFNVVETITENPAWSGTKSGVVEDYDLDAITLDTGETQGIYYFAGSVILGAIYTSRITAVIEAGGVNENQDILAVEDILALDDWFGASAGSWGVTLQYRTTMEDPGSSPAEWSAWQPLIVEDISFYAVEFRLILNSYAEGIKPLATRATVTVDMPDRSVRLENVTIPDTGYRLVIDPPMRASPVVSFTPRDFATGDYFLITSVDETGFTVTCYDDTDTAVERHGDPEAKGYGFAT